MRYGRRRFLIGATAALGGSIVLATCRRRGRDGAHPQPAAPAPAPPSNLDEPLNAASFRPAPPAAEPVLRVRVLKVRHTAAPQHIGSDGQWLHLRGEAISGKGIAVAGPVAIAMSPLGWDIVDAMGLRAAARGRAPLHISQPDEASKELVAIRSTEGEARRYPGSFTLVSRHDLTPDAQTEADSSIPGAASGGRGGGSGGDGSFDVVNRVPLETYLPGVLAGELYRHWKSETYAAQAVAARSFACTEAAIFARARHYDLTNTASSQMYLGGVEHARAHEAVQRTRGRVLVYEGLLVSGYYSSCCGGVAASAADAIGSNPVNDVAPLHGRTGSDVCTGAPVYAWSVQHPLRDFAARLDAYLRDRGRSLPDMFGPPVAIETIAANAHGRPTRLRISNAAGAAVELRAEDFRRAANYGDAALPPPEKELRSSNVIAMIAGETVMFDGHGFGHGVGLCQWGAEALATGGMPHEEIIRWYYPTVELLEAY